MRKYFVYVDDGTTCRRFAIPAANESEARNATSINGTRLSALGEIIAVRDVTETFHIDANDVLDALESAHFGKEQIDFVLNTLLTEHIAS